MYNVCMVADIFSYDQRGTIVEKLTEETLRDWNHLKELLSICEGNAFCKSLLPIMLEFCVSNSVQYCSSKTNRRDLIE